MNYFKTLFPILGILLLTIVSSCNIEPYEGEIQDQIDDDKLDKPDSCVEATQNTADAGAVFIGASSGDANYFELCNAYKTALEYQIELCGDQGGVLQIIIDNLDCGEDNGDDGDTPPASIKAFMTANINGLEYNDMKPNGYLFFPSGVSINDFFSRADEDYILIQGNNEYQNPTLITDTGREINLRVPKSLWKEGTFTLYDDLNDIDEGVCFYTFFGLNKPGDVFTKELPGEIIITKFDLDERIIQGTFEFEYMMVKESDDSEEGPFKVTGTFDYSLDDEYFD